MLDKFTMPDTARVIWKKTWTIASIQIYVPKSFYHFGLKRYSIPFMAPSRKIPLKNRIKNKKYGAMAVKVITFPEDLTPLLMTK